MRHPMTVHDPLSHPLPSPPLYKVPSSKFLPSKQNITTLIIGVCVPACSKEPCSLVQHPSPLHFFQQMGNFTHAFVSGKLYAYNSIKACIHSVFTILEGVV